ncbi:MAG: hypothetical protein AAGF91_02300 [Actinomycetota bacterium]
MGYVFGRAFWWIIAALLLGFVIGYYWNGWRRNRWVYSSSTSASGTTPEADASEASQLRSRVADLEAEAESLNAENGQLATQVSDLETKLADCRAEVDALPSASPAAAGAAGAAGGAAIAGFASLPDADDEPPPPADPYAGVDYDLDAAAAAIGSKVVMDDLKVVEGIGPKIEELLQAGGVGTWAGLATTAVERLQEILDGGGPRYQVHDPGTWPRQADLLASARWDEFTTLTDELDGGRE